MGARYNLRPGPNLNTLEKGRKVATPPPPKYIPSAAGRHQHIDTFDGGELTNDAADLEPLKFVRYRR